MMASIVKANSLSCWTSSSAIDANGALLPSKSARDVLINLSSLCRDSKVDFLREQAVQPLQDQSDGWIRHCLQIKNLFDGADGALEERK